MENLFKLFSAVMKVPVDKLTTDTNRNDLETWDSLAHLRIVAEIEEIYDISIPFEDIPNLRTIGDFMKYIKG